jgi:tetratricopeptide (TPR) repeat protein
VPRWGLTLTMTRGAGVVLCLWLAACSARQPPSRLHVDLSRADALLLDGCYRCLQEALALYEDAARDTDGSVPAVSGAYRAALLLAVRAKELGLPTATTTETARRWAARQRAPATGLAPQAYLDALDLIVGEVSGLPPEEREQRNRERREAWPAAAGELPAARNALTSFVETDVVAQYLALAIDCENARLRKAVAHEAVLARYPTALIRFRTALCGIPGLLLEPLRDADARWTDTLFYEGRHEMSRFPAPDVSRAAELFEQAHAAFPESVAITLALGNARNALEEFAPALALFDGILAQQPTHREALLGRLLSLSYLRRHYDAIRTATQMIELGTYHMGDAYYWRAWNRYQVHDLPPAWTDVENARTLMVNTAVYTLAGFIAYASRDLETAIARLSRAFALDNTNCEAVWTEGMVHVDMEDWDVSSARFTTAAGCFASDANAARDAIRTAQESSWAEHVKARRIATAQKRVDTSDHRHAQSAFNAASSYLRLGRKAEALGYADQAAQHPLLKEKAAALRTAIEKLP